MYIVGWVMTTLILICSIAGLVWKMSPLIPAFFGASPGAERILRMARMYAIGFGVVGIGLLITANGYQFPPAYYLILSILLLPLLPRLPNHKRAESP